jgi:predicted O-linked N-acetylglucosamine transferase (SPINDLY family)
VLWLVDDNPAATKNLRQQAQRMGIAPDRLIFTGRIAHAIYRQALGLADVFLDTYPYNCGSTAVDVVAAGLPLITLRGKTMVSRMGASLLKGSGAAGQVTDSFEAYERAALEWANGVRANANQPRTFGQATVVSTEQMVASMERQLIDRLKKLGYAGAFDTPTCVRSNQS